MNAPVRLDVNPPEESAGLHSKPTLQGSLALDYPGNNLARG